MFLLLLLLLLLHIALPHLVLRLVFLLQCFNMIALILIDRTSTSSSIISDTTTIIISITMMSLLPKYLSINQINRSPNSSSIIENFLALLKLSHFKLFRQYISYSSRLFFISLLLLSPSVFAYSLEFVLLFYCFIFIFIIRFYCILFCIRINLIDYCLFFF